MSTGSALQSSFIQIAIPPNPTTFLGTDDSSEDDDTVICESQSAKEINIGDWSSAAASHHLSWLRFDLGHEFITEIDLSTLLKDEQNKFTRKLLNLLDQEPIETGNRHPVERLIANSLQSYESMAINWIQAIYLRNFKRRPSISAAILRCVGRLDTVLTAPWGVGLAISGLSSPDVEIREAGVRALEMWGGIESLETLKVYIAIEQESWLKEYIQDVIIDFESE